MFPWGKHSKLILYVFFFFFFALFHGALPQMVQEFNCTNFFLLQRPLISFALHLWHIVIMCFYCLTVHLGYSGFMQPHRPFWNNFYCVCIRHWGRWTCRRSRRPNGTWYHHTEKNLPWNHMPACSVLPVKHWTCLRVKLLAPGLCTMQPCQVFSSTPKFYEVNRLNQQPSSTLHWELMLNHNFAEFQGKKSPG